MARKLSSRRVDDAVSRVVEFWTTPLQVLRCTAAKLPLRGLRVVRVVPRIVIGSSQACGLLLEPLGADVDFGARAGADIHFCATAIG